MKHWFLVLSLVLSQTLLAQGAGELDLNFGTNGKVLIEHNLGSTPPLAEGDEAARAIYIYPNHQFLIGGHAYHTNSFNVDMVVTKRLHHGGIDTSWGNQGRVVVAFDLGADNQDFLNAIEVDPNGNIYLIGSVQRSSGDDRDFAIARLTPSGALDTSFSDDGKLAVYFDNGGTLSDIAFDGFAGTSSITVVGYATQNTGTDFAITKVLSDGTLDPFFGTNGKLTVDFNHSTNSNDIAYKIYGDGSYSWVVGSASENDNSDSPAILRISSGGSIDISFSTDGKFVYSDSRAGTRINNVAKKNNLNEFAFVGTDYHPENLSLKDDCSIVYVNADSTNAGEPVADTFNFNLDPFPSLFDFNSGCKSAIFSYYDNILHLTGNLYPDDISSISMAALRFNSISVTNGSSSHSIDNNFGTNGRQVIGGFSSGASGQIVDSPFSIAVDYNKNVLIAGTGTNSNDVQKTAVARLIGDGGQAPSISITAPANTATFIEYEPITFTGIATDPEDGTISNNIQWSSGIDGYFGNGSTYITGNSHLNLSVGIHLITASITDSDLRTNEATIIIEVTERQDDPVVVISNPLNNSMHTQGSMINFVATASDDEDGVITPNIQWYSAIDGFIGTGGNISIDSLSVGQHVITAQIFDSNNQSDAHQIQIIITEVEDAPVVTISNPLNGSTFIQGSNINFVASAIDDEDGDITSNIQWDSANDGLLGTGGNISIDSLSVGQHLISAQIFDSNNQSDTKQITINIQPNLDLIFKNNFEQ
jgi:uncharacterized delta-60 repeat protein